MTKFTDISKVLLLGAAMTIGTFSFNTSAFAEGEEEEYVDSWVTVCDLDGYTISPQCEGGVFDYYPYTAQEVDLCSRWENDVYDAADMYYYNNGYYPAWFYYWQGNGFSFVGYTGTERPVSWYGADLISNQDYSCNGDPYDDFEY